MKLIQLNELSQSRDMIDVFGGYNHNMRIAENEFYDMENLTSDYYPALSPRGKRGVFLDTGSDICGVVHKDKLCWLCVKKKENYTNVYKLHLNYEDGEIDLGDTKYGADVERSMISMGAYLIIMPDKKYFNTADSDDMGDIEHVFRLVAGCLKFSPCNAEGKEYNVDIIGEVTPKGYTKGDTAGDGYGDSQLTNGLIWYDTAHNTLKMYSEANRTWTELFTVHTKITAEGIGIGFEAGDGVWIDGIQGHDGYDNLNDKNCTVLAREDDYIVINMAMASPFGPGYEIEEPYGYINVHREMPEMDFVTESNNRLWGCRYGKDKKGKFVNEIYASKLGDFKNWNTFVGASTDSYVASVGSDGKFTGACSYFGYPMFFKENCIYTIYGSYPAQYQVQDTVCRGVQKGSEKSLVMINEVLYYKSNSGICAYSGSLPTEISAALGNINYDSAAAFSNKGKYYVSMRNVDDGKYYLFVYDTKKGIWHKEDNLKIKLICSDGKDVYYVTANEVSVIKNINGGATATEDDIRWSAQTGVIGMSSPDKKYISRITLRIKLNVGANVKVFIQYDSCGEWEAICALEGHNLQTFALPIRPKRCDHFRLKIMGKGEAKIFSVVKVTENGSDN